MDSVDPHSGDHPLIHCAITLLQVVSDNAVSGVPSDAVAILATITTFDTNRNDHVMHSFVFLLFSSSIQSIIDCSCLVRSHRNSPVVFITSL